MSINTINNSTILNRQLHRGAVENAAYLIGRILTITGPNPTYNPDKPDTEFNTPLKSEIVTMTKEGLRDSQFAEWVSDSPITFSLGDGCSVMVPTGYKYENANKEHFIEYLGPCLVQHGDVKVFKPLSALFSPE